MVLIVSHKNYTVEGYIPDLTVDARRGVIVHAEYVMREGDCERLFLRVQYLKNPALSGIDAPRDEGLFVLNGSKNIDEIMADMNLKDKLGIAHKLQGLDVDVLLQNRDNVTRIVGFAKR